MKDVFENQLSRAQKVNEFITSHAADLTATPEIASTLQPQLQAAIIQTQTDDSKASEDDTGYATQKEDIRLQLNEAAFHVSTGLVSYGDDHDDFVMMNMFDFPISSMQHFRDTHIAQFAQDVISKASNATIAAELVTNHNVSAADVTAVSTLLAQFNTAISKPRAHIGEKSAYVKQVARDVRGIIDILNRIVRKMATYRSSNRLLFDAFGACNAIDDDV